MTAIEDARERTYGGANHVLECVGAESSMETTAEVARPGRAIGYVGVPEGVETTGFLGTMFGKNVSFNGGVAPVRNDVDVLR